MAKPHFGRVRAAPILGAQADALVVEAAVYRTDQEGETRLFATGLYRDQLELAGGRLRIRDKLILLDTLCRAQPACNAAVTGDAPGPPIPIADPFAERPPARISWAQRSPGSERRLLIEWKPERRAVRLDAPCVPLINLAP